MSWGPYLLWSLLWMQSATDILTMWLSRTLSLNIGLFSSLLLSTSKHYQHITYFSKMIIQLLEDSQSNQLKTTLTEHKLCVWHVSCLNWIFSLHWILLRHSSLSNTVTQMVHWYEYYFKDFKYFSQISTTPELYIGQNQHCPSRWIK